MVVVVIIVFVVSSYLWVDLGWSWTFGITGYNRYIWKIKQTNTGCLGCIEIPVNLIRRKLKMAYFYFIKTQKKHLLTQLSPLNCLFCLHSKCYFSSLVFQRSVRLPFSSDPSRSVALLPENHYFCLKLLLKTMR